MLNGPALRYISIGSFPVLEIPHCVRDDRSFFINEGGEAAIRACSLFFQPVFLARIAASPLVDPMRVVIPSASEESQTPVA